MYRILLIFLSLALSSACLARGVEKVDGRVDRGPTTVGIDYRDFEDAASDAVQSLLSSGAVVNPDGGRYVLMISRIVNDTMQRIDTDQLVKKIRIELLNSGRVVVTTAVSGDGAEDRANFQVREDLRGNDEFDQSRVQRRGTLVAPDISLSGKILQRNLTIDRRKQQIEYYFQLTLTDLETGLAVWENEFPIIKRASNRSVGW
jgi:penicillin-binding protein activator